MRPGGLFISCEWLDGIYHSSGSLQDIAPHAYHYLYLLQQAFRQQGIPNIVSRIPDFIRDSGLFEEPHTQRFPMVLGNPAIQEAGDPRLMYREVVMRYAASLKYLFLDHEMPLAEANNLVNNFLRDIDDVQELRLYYNVVYARRL